MCTLAKAFATTSAEQLIVAIARESVYPGVPEKTPQALSDEYIAAAVPIVEERPQQAGVRLATVLNNTLK